jgi:glycine cleavage system H protein
VVDQPELINNDAHGKGWLVRVKILNESDMDGLLSAHEYEELITQKS